MIQLSDHFTYKRLIKFTLPSIIMILFTSVYGVVDGFFVSNFAGKTPFAAVNFIMPVLMILGCIGFMFGTGGSALLSLIMGQGKTEKANEIFSMLVYVSAFCGVVLAVLGILLLRPIASLMGADGKLLDDCVFYGRIILLALPCFVLQYEFQCLFAAAGKPSLGLYITLASGMTNIILDALFVAVCSWGLAGAAAATACSQFVGGVCPLIYFGRKNSSSFRLGKFRFDGRALWKTCTNGASELMSNISMSVVSMLYNIQLMRYAGENGIAAYGVLMYVSMIFQAVFIGYAVGAAPIVSYHYGAQNSGEVKNILAKSLLFVGYEKELLEMTVQAFSIFSVSFLFSGFAILGSSFFTALNDGLTSAAIAFLRTLVIQVAAVIIFPIIWGLNGIWWSIVAAEVMAVAVTGLFFIGKKKKFLPQ